MALGTLADSNVLLDVFTDDPRWGSWSAEHLASAFDVGSVVINPLIFAEQQAHARVHLTCAAAGRRDPVGADVGRWTLACMDLRAL